MATFWKAPSKNFFSTTLDGSIDDSETTITLASVTNLQAPGVLIIDREDGTGNATPSSREVITYTGISSNDLTGVTRGVDGSTAQAHSDGALVEATSTVGIWNDLRDAVNTVLAGDAAGTNVYASVATISVADTENKVALTVLQKDTTNNPVGVTLENDGTGDALFINQDGDGVSINIDSEATTSTVLNISAQNTEGQLFKLVNNAAQTTNEMVALIQENASTTKPVLFTRNDGSGKTIDDSTGANLSNAGVWTDAASYRRYKDKVGELDDVLAKIDKLDVDIWEYKDKEIDGKNRRVGDESQHCSPYLDDFHETFKLGDGTGVVPMDYIGVLFNAVKELKARVEELEQEEV